MLSNFTAEGGWSKKVSLQNSKHLRAQHQNWTWASKRGRPSRSVSEWVFSSSISHVNNLWYNTFFDCWFVDVWLSDCMMQMQVIKQAFPKLINLLQNIKKKEAGGAKTRPAAGGLLPPPPGAKAGGLIPPPGGQQSFPPVQTNNGEHQCLCQTPVYLSSFIKQYSFSPIFPISADPAPLLDFGSPVPAAQPSSDVWGDFTSAGSK